MFVAGSWLGGGGLEFHGKVMAGDVHAFVKVEAMRAQTSDAGVEMKFRATFAPCLLNEPVDQHSAIASAAIARAGDEIINMHETAPSESLHDTPAGDRAHFA